MRQLSFKRHRFPADIIRHSVWLYAKFALSCRDVDEIKTAQRQSRTKVDEEAAQEAGLRANQDRDG